MPKKNSKNPKELQEIEAAYWDITGHRPKKKQKSSGFFRFLLVFVAIIGCMLVGFTFLFGDPAALLSEIGDVSVGPLDLQGMTLWETKQTLNAQNRIYEATPMTVTVLDSTVTLSPAVTHVALDVDKLLEDVRNAPDGTKLDPAAYLQWEEDALRSALSIFESQYGVPSAETVWSIEGQKPPLDPWSSQQDGQILSITVGTPAYGLDMDALYQEVLSAYAHQRFQVAMECTMVAPKLPDLDAIYQQTYIAPVDAVINEKTFAITSEVYGYGFDLADAKQQLEAAQYGQRLRIPLQRIAPAVTAQTLQSMLYRDVLASYQTKHTADENRNTNLRLACQAVNGRVLMPGEEFSYNETLGRRTAEKGYMGADAYMNGQTVTTIGGGICQVSSTIYYCALLADLDIVERRAHSFVSAYMPLGMDAVVSWGTLDFKFRNNTNYPIRMEAKVADGYVQVQLIGTEEKDYYIEMEYEVLDTLPYTTVYQQMPADNEKGYVDGQVLTTPYTGYKVKTYKCKYDKQTDVLISREFEANSNYKKRDEVVCAIIGSTAPTESTEALDAPRG